MRTMASEFSRLDWLAAILSQSLMRNSGRPLELESPRSGPDTREEALDGET